MIDIPHYLYIVILKYRMPPTQLGIKPLSISLVSNIFRVKDFISIRARLLAFVEKYSTLLND